MSKYNDVNDNVSLMLEMCELDLGDDDVNSLINDIKSIEERLETTDSVPQAKEVYYILSNLLLNNTMPTCCEIN